MLRLTTDEHKGSRGLSATAELLVMLGQARLHGRRRHYVLWFSVGLSVRSSISKLLWTSFFENNEPILMQIGTSRQRDKGVKWSTLELRRSKVRSREAEDRFGGLAEASFSARLVE